MDAPDISCPDISHTLTSETVTSDTVTSETVISETEVKSNEDDDHQVIYSHYDFSAPAAVDYHQPITDGFAKIKSTYRRPKYPIVLAHGLLGFDELHIAGKSLPGQ